jgi:glutamine amidotransferase-like uncharacterized protein
MVDRLEPHLAMIRLVVIAVALTSCQHGRNRSARSSVLVFDGTGTSDSDVAAIESVLTEGGLAYTTASSSRLDEMSNVELAAYRLLIVPGGNFETMGNHLQPTTAAKIHSAVQNGLGYLGICAGAFIAGDSPYNGFNLTGGVRFHFYSDESRGIRKAAVAVARPREPPIDQYWEDGPELSGWGEVVAKYPDGTPAIVEGPVGRGWAILVGVHPEAPASWRRGMAFATTVDVDRAYAATLVNAALQRTTLPHF